MYTSHLDKSIQNKNQTKPKTGLICISEAINYEVDCFINLPNGEKINSSKNMWVLGYHFGNKANAEEHVSHLEAKNNARIWYIRHLMYAKIKQCELVLVFTTSIRPAIEFCATVYGPMLNETQSKRVENLQKAILKAIFPGLSYGCLLYTSPSPRDKRQSRMPSSA